MKKRRKFLESPSIRIYEQLMRKLLLNNLGWLILLSLIGIASPAFAVNPTFLLLNDGADAVDVANRLENLGVRVRQRIPPQILVADFPDSLSPFGIPTIKTAYSGAVPLNVLEPLGPLAVAAGMQWNRSLVQSAHAAGLGTLGAMRMQLAQKSLPGPQNLAISPVNQSLHATWSALNGALYYEVELALDPSFNNRLAFSQTNLPEINLPQPTGNSPVIVYVRVRGVDHIDTDGNREEIYGAYSSPVSLQVPAVADDGSLVVPTLASPLPNYQSHGFTLILEWDADPARTYRVQVSRSNDFSSTVFDTTLQTGTFVCPSPGLKVGDILFWRVKIIGDHSSGWSEVRSLTIQPPSSEKADTLINPEAPK